MKAVRLGFVAIISILGFYFLFAMSDFKLKLSAVEAFESKKLPQCPDLLIQENGKFYLYNRRLARVPGVNPIVFNTLNGYVDFMKWQRSQGLSCKVLFLQKSVNAQGEVDYAGWRRADWQGIETINASSRKRKGRDERRSVRILMDKALSDKQLPPFDPQDQLIGLRNPIDRKFTRSVTKHGLSVNPMDTNWGGPEFTNRNTKEIRDADKREKTIMSRLSEPNR